LTILHVISGLGTGGAEAMLLQVASALQARGMPQHVVSVTDRGRYADEFEARHHGYCRVPGHYRAAGARRLRS
jgi:hypothetical protein